MNLTALLSSAASSSGARSPVMMLTLALMILAADLAMVYSAWKKGTLFDNIIKSGIIYGLPVLLAGFLVFIGFVGGKGCAGSDLDDYSNGGRYSWIYQRYYEDLGETDDFLGL